MRIDWEVLKGKSSLKWVPNLLGETGGNGWSGVLKLINMCKKVVNTCLIWIEKWVASSRVWGGAENGDCLGSVEGWILTEMGSQTFWVKLGVSKLIKICKKVVNTCLTWFEKWVTRGFEVELILSIDWVVLKGESSLKWVSKLHGWNWLAGSFKVDQNMPKSG